MSYSSLLTFFLPNFLHLKQLLPTAMQPARAATQLVAAVGGG